MNENDSLQRFVTAQTGSYGLALSEMKDGKKRSHWMWFIFPQIRGLGSSEASRYYGIRDLKEAEAFLNHPVLGNRIIEISGVLLTLGTNDAHEVFGSPDDLKLKSSMTLFSEVENTNPVFKAVLQKFFKAERDQATLKMLGQK